MNEQNKNDWEADSILAAYNEIKIKVPEIKADSLKVVKSVIFHRDFWKPQEVKTILLAESHVFTSDNQNSIVLDYPDHPVFASLPKEFVKLVYCLGYGEYNLMPDLSSKENPGTWQYWKIFSACCAESFEEFEAEFYNVQKGGCPEYVNRLINKIKLLIKLKNKGVWLVDSSIISLYGLEKKPSIENISKAILISWKQYISKLIEDTNPKQIIIIGKGVSKILKNEIGKLDISFSVVSQPQERMDVEEIEKMHKTYISICNK